MTVEKLTTPGAILLKHSMPTKESRDRFDIYRPLDKDAVGDTINMLLQYGGENSHEHINTLAKTFFNKATEIGASTPLSDYINNSDERQAIVDEFDFKAQQLFNSDRSRAEKQHDIVDLTSQYNKKIEKQNLDYLLSKGSVAAKMAKTKARGNASQLATGTSTPLLSTNLKGDPIPVVIKSSFAKGMSPAEHIAMSYMGRGNTVLTQLSTSKPGALFKQLSPTVFHEVITVDNCHTKNGIMIPIKDKKSLIGRYTADTDKLIDEAYYKELSMSSVPAVKARSAMTCEAHEGVCRHCYGLMGNGKLPEIGENVGVIAAQSVSEVLTQAMLSTKHKATVGERKGNAYEQASNILRNPSENFQDEATISEVNGKVQDVRKTPLGDYNVTIGDKVHFVPQIQKVTVEAGQKIRKGDALSTGVVNPRKLVALRGLGAGRQYMANELRDIYRGGLDPRHFELIAKNLMKYVEVVDPGKTGFLPGDKIDVNTVQKYLKKSSKEVPVEQAEGSVLATGMHELTPGTMLDANHVEDLKNAGVKTVRITDNGMKVVPIVPGLQTAKLLDSNWVSRLSFSRLKDTLQESAARGLESDTHGTDPITPYIIGNEFGEGEHGQY